MFLIEPFEQYFSHSFLESLTEENSKTIFHEQMLKWGEIEQYEHATEIIYTIEFPDGAKHNRTQFKNPDVRWSRKFIISAFYNLCYLASRKITLEELIFNSNQVPTKDNKEEGDKAFFQLISISKIIYLLNGQKILFKELYQSGYKKIFHRRNFVLMRLM